MKFFSRKNNLNSTRGSAMVQALTLVMMLGLVSAGLAEYSKSSSSYLLSKKKTFRNSGIAAALEGILRSPALCIAGLNLDANGDNAFGKQLADADVTNGNVIPVEMTLPYYEDPANPGNDLTVPWVDRNATPLLDPFNLDYGVTVERINLTILNEINPPATAVPGDGTYLAELTALLVEKRRLLSLPGEPYVPAGKAKIATVQIQRSGGLLTSCSLSGSAKTFCEENLKCSYDDTRTPACNCGYENKSCPANQYIQSFAADGTPICAPFPIMQCDPAHPEYAFIGLKKDPDPATTFLPQCRRWGDACRAAAGTLSWTNAASGTGNTCTNTFDIWVPNGETLPVAFDSFDGPGPDAGLGTAGVNCSAGVATIAAHVAGTDTEQICSGSPPLYHWEASAWDNSACGAPPAGVWYLHSYDGCKNQPYQGCNTEYTTQSDCEAAAEGIPFTKAPSFGTCSQTTGTCGISYTCASAPASGPGSGVYSLCYLNSTDCLSFPGDAGLLCSDVPACVGVWGTCSPTYGLRTCCRAAGLYHESCLPYGGG